MENVRIPGQDVRYATPVDEAFETGEMYALMARGRQMRAQAFNHAISDVVSRLRHVIR
jgi:hypothetical protein